ncbi:hypothetical protein ACTNDY_06460 [Tissierellaceae bacterium HCP3S3_D8]
MRKAFLILCIVVVSFFILRQCYDSQYKDYSLYPTQDIININNKGFGDDVFEVGDFDYDNPFLNMSKTYYPPLMYSLLKDYDNGNYRLVISDFGNEKGDIVTNSEFKFHNDTGKAWFFVDDKSLGEKYSFFASIVVDNNKIKIPIKRKIPIKIKIYDDNNHVFGYIRCVYRNTLYKEEKIYYIPLSKQSFGYSVDFDSKVKGYTLEYFGIFIVFKETVNDISLEIETNKSQFQYDVELSETMVLDNKNK